MGRPQGRPRPPSRPRPQNNEVFLGNGGFTRPQSRGGCSGGGNEPNHRFEGRDYLVSWRLGCASFTQGGAANFCRQNNMQPISIDSSSKEREFLGLVGREGQKYFWTGGSVSGRSIRWPSGRSYSSVDWSNTGGANRPQPDNREGDETCLAVLNNFYNDGIRYILRSTFLIFYSRFHDVSCHHKKPTICEA